jgi:hypothetical protein
LRGDHRPRGGRAAGTEPLTAASFPALSLCLAVSCLGRHGVHAVAHRGA